METKPATHPRAVQKTWTIRNRYGYIYAKICIFPTVSLSNGRRLTRLRDIWTSNEKRGVWCLTLLSGKVTSQGRSLWVSPATKWTYSSVKSKFWQHLPCTGRFPKPASNITARWPTTTSTPTERHDGRQPHIAHKKANNSWFILF